jgi:hypothetical protein
MQWKNERKKKKGEKFQLQMTDPFVISLVSETYATHSETVSAPMALCKP